MPQQSCSSLYVFALGNLQESLKSGAWEKETFCVLCSPNLAPQCSPALPCLMGEQSWAPYLTSGYLVTKPSTSRLSRAVSLRQSSSRTANTASRFCWLLSRP